MRPVLDGGADNDALVAADDGTRFTITSPDGGQLANLAGENLISNQSNNNGFVNIENLTGAAEDDSFIFEDGGRISGDVTGGAGMNHLNYSARTDDIMATLTASDVGGFDGRATAIGGGIEDIDRLTGGVGTNSLTGTSATATWTLVGAAENTYAVGGQRLIFSNFENLTGGAGADAFNIMAVLMGNLAGGAGDDTFTFENNASIMGDLTGGAGTDTLIGDDDGNTFTLTGNGAGMLAGKITGGGFTNVENLTGGAGADTFNINANHSGDMTGAAGDDAFNLNATLTGNVAGGAGADTFTFANNTSVSGSITGGAGRDHLNYSARADDITVTLTGSYALGFDGRATATGGIEDIDRLTGGAGMDSLTGYDAIATWTLGAQGSTYRAGSESLAFSGFDTFTGGAGDDTFILEDNTSIMGGITGGAGRDHLNYNSRAAAIAVTLTASDAGGFDGTEMAIGGGIEDIDRLTGGMTVMDSLIGIAGATATWDFLGAAGNTYAVMRPVVGGQPATDTLTFTGFENLSSGAGDDVFNVAASIMGNVEGGAGDDMFIFSGAGEITGSLSGGAGDDTLNFLALSDAQRLSVMITDAATGTGTASFLNGGNPSGFTGIENLMGTLARVTGPNQNTLWTLAPAGNNYQELDPSGQPVPGTLFNLPQNVNTLTGGGLSDTFNISTAFAGTLQGGAGDNTFTFEDSGSIAGAVTGGMDNDHLNYASRTDAITVTLTGSDATGFSGRATGLTGGFSGVNQLTGGMTDRDSLMGIAGATATWTFGANNTYAVMRPVAGGQSATDALSFSSFENLTGNDMADTFNINAPYSGSIDGGDGGDIFNIASRLTGDVEGGAGDDMFIFSGAGEITGTLSGGAGDDALNFLALGQMPNVRITDAAVGAGEASFIGGAGGFTGIETLIGELDSFAGQADRDALWTLAAAGNTYQALTAPASDPGARPVGALITLAADINTLTGGGLSDTFNISTAFAGTLQGGAGDNTFTFEDSGSIAGAVTGGMDNDHLNYASRTDAITVTLTGSDATGFSGRATGLTGGFSGVNQLTGGMTDRDSLMGIAGATATWTFGANNTYAVMRPVAGGQSATDALSFSSFENLTGNDMADTFNINAPYSGSIDGGDGGDIFNIASRLTGDVEGGAGDDMFIFSGAGEITGTLSGGAGDDALNFLALGQMPNVRITDAAVGAGEASFIGGAGGFTGIETLIGELDSFAGQADRDALWTLAAAGNTYQALTAPASDPGARPVGALITLAADINTLTGGGLSDTFNISTAFAGTLQGGAGDNTFTFEDSGSIAGAVTGGMDNDHLNYASRTDAITVTLTGSDATGFSGRATGLTGGFSGVNQLTGGMTDRDSLMGIAGATATWTFGANNTYAVMRPVAGGQSATDALSFSSFENLTGNDMADTFNINAPYSGSIDGGDGNDTININMGGAVTGDIDAGEGDDEITLDGDARITGDINLGEGDDTLTFASADVRFMGLADGGAGTDTLNGLDIFTDAMPTTLFRYTNFEVVNGEAELLANLPVLRMETTESGGAMRTLIAYVDDPSAGMIRGRQQPRPDSSAGTATPTTAGQTRIAALSQDYGGQVTPLNADGNGPRDVNAYLFVDPTGPAALAASVGALSTAVNNIINQRLSGGLPGGSHSVRSAQVAAGALLPGLLAGGSDPLIWGELFAAERRRGRDGLNLAHGHDYRGVLFGAEQGYANGQQRLGLLFGYADADINTHLRSLDLETGSVFGGLYGRIAKESLDINLGLNLGYEFHDNRRYIPQLLAVAEADYNSVFINPWLGLTREYPLQDNLSLRPLLALNYTFARYEGYEEHGGEGFGIDVGSRTAHSLSTRAQVAGVWTRPDTSNELGLRLGVEGRLAGGGDFKGSLGGSSFSYSDTGDKRAQSLFIGIDGRHAFSDDLILQVDVEYSHDLGGVSERTLGGFVRLEYEY